MTRFKPAITALSSSALFAATTLSVGGCSADSSGLFTSEADATEIGGAGGSGGSSNGGSGDGGTSGGSAGAPACQPLKATPDRIATYIEFAIDASGSMANGDRWQALRAGFASALSDYPNSVHAGATVFPGVPTTTPEYCYAAKQNVPIATIDPEQEQRFQNLFFAQSPGGGSPTHPAMRFGYGQVNFVAKDELALRVLVLITDGEANYSFGESGEMGRDCVGNGENRWSVPQEPLVEEVRAAAAGGVYTFAVGLPGSEGFADILSDVAREGGTGPDGCGASECHLDLSRAGEDLVEWVHATIAGIGPAVQSCTYPVPESGDHDPEAALVEYHGDSGPEQLALAGNCVTDPGYQLSPGYVHLCGETCRQSQAEGGTLRLELPCR